MTHSNCFYINQINKNVHDGYLEAEREHFNGWWLKLCSLKFFSIQLFIYNISSLEEETIWYFPPGEAKAHCLRVLGWITILVEKCNSLGKLLTSNKVLTLEEVDCKQDLLADATYYWERRKNICYRDKAKPSMK